MTDPRDQRHPDAGANPYPPPGQQYGQQYGQPFGRPYDGAGDPPYVYNPYGNVDYPTSYPMAPAGLEGDPGGLPPRRPGAVHLALVLLVVSALPYLFIGLLFLLVGGSTEAALPPEQLEQMRELGIDVNQIVQVAGTVLTVVAAVFIVLSVLAWTGRRWARALVAAMTAGFALMVVASVVVAGAQVPLDSLVVLVGPVLLAVVALVILFGPAAGAWYRARRH